MLVAGPYRRLLPRLRALENPRDVAGCAGLEANPLIDFSNPGLVTLCRVSQVYLRVRLPIGEGSQGEFLA